MVVEMFHDQISTKECFAGREDRIRDRPHTRRTRIRSNYRAWPNFLMKMEQNKKFYFPEVPKKVLGKGVKSG